MGWELDPQMQRGQAVVSSSASVQGSPCRPASCPHIVSTKEAVCPLQLADMAQALRPEHACAGQASGKAP